MSDYPIGPSGFPEWSPSEDVRLILGDCLQVLPTLSGIDAVVTSPPYNQRVDGFKASGFKAEGASCWADRAASAYFDSMPEDEYQEWQRLILSAALSSCSPSASLFYNHKCRWRNKKILHPLDIVRCTPWNVRQEVIWLRDGSLTQNAKMFPPCEERIIWCYNETWKWNQESNRFLSVWRIDSEKWSSHPLAYPVEIPIRCIDATTDQGDLVVDPFSGSATTGVACVRTGRRFIGIEIEPRYFDIAVRRIDAELNRFPLLEPARPRQRELI